MPLYLKHVLAHIFQLAPLMLTGKDALAHQIITQDGSLNPDSDIMRSCWMKVAILP